jgi:hypothetical protein
MYDKTGKLHFFLNDHLGSARMVIDSAGVVKDKYKRYFAYGGGASQTVSTGQKHQYPGQPYDDDGAFDPPWIRYIKFTTTRDRALSSPMSGSLGFLLGFYDLGP